MVEPLALSITDALDCPTIGIGVSATCDAQVLVSDDMLRLKADTARFVRRFDDLADRIDKAAAFSASVRNHSFPEPRNLYGVSRS